MQEAITVIKRPMNAPTSAPINMLDLQKIVDIVLHSTLIVSPVNPLLDHLILVYTAVLVVRRATAEHSHNLITGGTVEPSVPLAIFINVPTAVLRTKKASYKNEL